MDSPFFQADKVPEKVLQQDKQNKGRVHKNMPKIDTIDTLCQGEGEGEVTSQLFGRLSLALMRFNGAMISSRCQDFDFPPAIVDGIE